MGITVAMGTGVWDEQAWRLLVTQVTIYNAGIPVFAIDRTVTGESVTTIEADNYLIGQQMAEMYLEYLGDGEGKV
ncbi:MAG: hypothetical protein IJJ45_04785, partial [Clostridia bacterium]|nr:hypothetical protein [Clostridia bacterium]